MSGGKLQRGSGGAGWLEAPTPGGGLPRQLRCVHVSLIIHACVAIASHVLTPSWLAFLTPYGLVVGSCVLLAGAAGAPLAGWRSRVAAILADDWRLPFMVVSWPAAPRMTVGLWRACHVWQECLRRAAVFGNACGRVV